MTLPAKAQCGGDKVTLDKLTRHFASRRLRKPQLIGLHAKSKETTSRWLGLDIDCHDSDTADAQDLGYDPLLYDFNG